MILELNYFYKIGLFRGFVGAQFIVPIKVIKNYRDVKLFFIYERFHKSGDLGFGIDYKSQVAGDRDQRFILQNLYFHQFRLFPNRVDNNP
jgi:hypothetical protein